ncbi:SPFH domain-containing protein [Candidatus Thiothrix anitrata]|jgi:uncharacterized membrane protein YqiK|uniref:Band 7 domain-containing protein n=1 Tax=Candidatus Thiothrix anitrata TaxID=2823902 RepID=A0ABX7WZG0_9GAMM|nr:SPFH domain-containing protein [Candidatus Thiothrix anitrata]QTR49012.1 hypothetical protein J8380_12090 [Candidatus Thiothrix anitrata]
MNIISQFYYEGLVVATAGVLMLLLYWLYFRPSAGSAYLRTGWGQPLVLLQKGAFVIPGLHRLTPLDLQTRSLELVLSGENSLRTKDLLRVDMSLIASVRIEATPEQLLKAGGVLQKAEWQDLSVWWEMECKGAAATLVARMTLENLHQQRQEILKCLTSILAARLQSCGLQLVALTMPVLAETDSRYYETASWMDAKGLALLESRRWDYRKQSHLQQRQSELMLRRTNFESALQCMEWERGEFLARLQHLHFKAEADAKAEQALEEIHVARALASEMIQRDVVLTRLQTQQELVAAQSAFTEKV